MIGKCKVFFSHGECNVRNYQSDLRVYRRSGERCKDTDKYHLSCARHLYESQENNTFRRYVYKCKDRRGD